MTLPRSISEGDAVLAFLRDSEVPILTADVESAAARLASDNLCRRRIWRNGAGRSCVDLVDRAEFCHVCDLLALLGESSPNMGATGDTLSGNRIERPGDASTSRGRSTPLGGARRG